MDSPWLLLLRIVLLFVLFGSVCGVPAMNALKDENRLDDGIALGHKRTSMLMD